MNAPRPHPPKTGQYLLLVLAASLLAFAVSTLTTTRILRRVSVVDVPDVVGKSVDAARGLLRVQRLSLDIIEFRFDSRLPADQVISQDPPAGSAVKSGRIVRVVVSRGSQSLKVPGLVGLEAREANVALSQKGLHPGRISRMYSDTPKNQVLAQWPAPGEESYPGRSVSLLVSAGPRPHQWLMPDLRGMNWTEGARVLKALDLEPDSITPRLDESAASNTVLTQNPLPGELVSAGGGVSLTVSRRQGDPSSGPDRLVTVQYRVPSGDLQVRVRLVVVDERGRREILNAMQRPDTEVRLRATLHGAPATLQIYLNGTLSEERKL
jgi:eukaryotic-like serine/threonine-protein kinase